MSSDLAINNEYKQWLTKFKTVKKRLRNGYPNISGFSGVACGHTECFNLWNGLTYGPNSMVLYGESAHYLLPIPKSK